MGNCKSNSIDFDNNTVQSVIFHRQVIKSNEILIWDEGRARSWLLQRNWIFIEPPDTSKDDQIRMHIINEDEFESLDYQDIGSGITIVFGVKPPPHPRRRRLMINNSKRSRVHNIHEQKDD